MASAVTARDRAPYTVLGYHGCHIDVANMLTSGGVFRLSDNDYDWLGSGAYFWEYAPFRAHLWAQRRHGAKAAIVRAEIALGYCLNLLDMEHFKDVKREYENVAKAFAETNISLPRNHRGRNQLDKLVLDEFCKSYAEEHGFFDTVRGCFPEGDPLFEGSQLMSHTHVQIAVRNIDCISQLELVHLD